LVQEKIHLALFGFKVNIKNFQNFIINEEINLNLTLKEKETAEINFFNSLENFINRINNFLNTKPIKKSKENKNLKRKASNDKKYKKFTDEIFNCKFCEKVFDTHQGLGGHMSRKHPFMSEKFKLKMSIREDRAFFRKIVYKARKILFAKLNYDYEELKQHKKNRNLIKRIRKENNLAYQKILKTLKEDYLK
jgi:hypothetical protein